MEHMTKLRHLHLASNLISSIGITLDPNVSLQELNLAGNRIGSFKDIALLDRLPNLTSVTFSDPHFGGVSACVRVVWKGRRGHHTQMHTHMHANALR